MLIKTRGIVLRVVKYGESSVICNIYTEAQGRQSYLVPGVRKRNARIGSSLLQVMSLVELVCYHKEQRELHHIREVRAAVVYQSIPFDVVKGAVGLFMAELSQKTVQENMPNEALFVFLFDSFCALDGTPNNVANVHLAFMAQLAGFMGFMVGGSYEIETPFLDLKEGTFVAETPSHSYFIKPTLSPVISRLLQTPLGDAHLIPIRHDERLLLLDKLLFFYQYHIDGFATLNSYHILKEIF